MKAASPNASPLALRRSVVLIGMMGAGKSTVGRRLATRLGVPFADSDEVIEEKLGCNVTTIFELNGETYFREVERRVISELLDGEIKVIATGGGAFVQPLTRALIKEKGTSLWMRADLDILLDRVSRRNNRPLLEGGDKREILARLMETRYPIYAEADIAIDSNSNSHETVLHAIVHALEQQGA